MGARSPIDESVELHDPASSRNLPAGICVHTSSSRPGLIVRLWAVMGGCAGVQLSVFASNRGRCTVPDSWRVVSGLLLGARRRVSRQNNHCVGEPL